MPSAASDLAEAFIQYRDAAEAAVLSGPSWYTGAPGAAGLEANADRITLATNIFRIRSTADRDGFKHTVSAVVERLQAADGSGWTCRILSWEVW